MTVLSTLTPVYGYNPDGSFATAPPPSVLQFAGVPPLQGGFGNQIGIGGGGQDVNASAGIGLPFTGMATALNAEAVGIGGSLDSGLSPYGSALNAALTYTLTADVPGGLFLPPVWGIFDANMQPIATWDSVVKVDYRHEMKISNFPIERGGFASYNKVQVPYDMRMSFSVGTGILKRTELLASLERAVASLDMYTVLTPEAVYVQANLTHMEYSRESRRGLNLLVVDVWIQEVRLTAGSAFVSDTAGKTPTYATATNNGAVQVQAVPTPADPNAPVVAPGLPGIGGTPGLDTPPPNMPGLGTTQPGAPTPAPGMPLGSLKPLPDFAPQIPEPEPFSVSPVGPGGSSILLSTDLGLS